MYTFRVYIMHGLYAMVMSFCLSLCAYLSGTGLIGNDLFSTLYIHELQLWVTAAVSNIRYCQIIHILQLKNLLDSTESSREQCLCQASKYVISLVWSWPLTNLHHSCYDTMYMLFSVSFIFILWGGTHSLCMPTLRPASQAGPMRNPREGTSVALRDTTRLIWWCV